MHSSAPHTTWNLPHRSIPNLWSEQASSELPESQRTGAQDLTSTLPVRETKQLQPQQCCCNSPKFTCRQSAALNAQAVVGSVGSISTAQELQVSPIACHHIMCFPHKLPDRADEATSMMVMLCLLPVMFCKQKATVHGPAFETDWL